MSGPSPRRIAIVAGERSGDALGAELAQALRRRLGEGVRFRGVAGPRMLAAGVETLFPMEDVAVMGVGPVIARLPTLLRRIRETADSLIADPPDLLVIVDSPDFTHRVARRLRAARPDVPIVDYVSPSVWAWRPGRARAMRAYVDQVLALLPFEPAAHERLGGPPCAYVGHPLIERLHELRPAPGERAEIGQGPARLLVLPGSRAGVAHRHMPLFGETLRRLAAAGHRFEVTLPTTERLADDIRRMAADWPAPPRIVLGEAEKLAAFRAGQAALAASGTVTLELALAGVPTAAAYRLEWFAPLLEPFIRIEAPFILLPNLILGERAIPECVHRDATPERLTAELAPLLHASPERAAQRAALARLDAVMRLPDGVTPSERAAEVTLAAWERGRRPAG
ncbi:lipid-A-disaccharide synthase [Methylopila jiangsuensis]|uniref:Lipid-A-disaccharide synthase n=1 Tax=Methylopila jiangsuensis TaxID=586230 RepID=A0A9W6JDR7_9HYPH|nr:lipid-A-disaccharide synthase [Methylopila jiangsuensis]MDR6285632.1 lipid-A-disaccharide synthase [Methylopila jiangsuensis]GLK75392.1 lipid-A-disaccharide synthase [Methylopila jiangsuensis]